MTAQAAPRGSSYRESIAGKDPVKQKLKKTSLKIGAALRRLLYPAACPVCDRTRPTDGLGICPQCRKMVQLTKEPYCLRCGQALEVDASLCVDCDRRTRSFDAGRSCFLNDDVIKPALYRLKFHHRKEIGDELAAEMVHYLGEQLLFWRPQLLIPIPISRKRRRSRGYNQAEVLARGIGCRLGVPVSESILVRVKETKALKELSKEERRQQMKRAFSVFGEVPETVVLVDDIYTTGATMDAAAAVLKEHGAVRVYFVCVCQGEGV